MRSMISHILIQRRYATLVLGLLVLLTPFHGVAQEATPPVPEPTSLMGVPAEPIDTQTESASTDVGTDPHLDPPGPEPTEPLALADDDVTAANTDEAEPATTDPEVLETAPLESDPGGAGTPAPQNGANVQESVVWVNTDTITLPEGVTNFTLAPGASKTVSFTYAVTTPRQGTSVQAELVDESGTTPDGWLLSPSGMSDVSALEPGTTFTTTVSVTAPDVPEAAQTVSLLIRSETTSDRGLEPGIDRQLLVTVTVTITEQPFSSPVAPNVVEPELTVQPLDFGVLTWKGELWGSAQATTTVTITHQSETGPGAYDIQLELTGDIPGFRPTLMGVSSPDEDITLLVTSGDPNDGPLAVARIPAGFTGTAELVLTFTVTPNADVSVGSHHLEMKVAIVTLP